MSALGLLEVWQELASDRCETLVAAAAETTPGDVAGIARLRKQFNNPELVRAAIDLAIARRKAAPKFGAERARAIWADPSGVEMATSAVTARYKAKRFTQALPAGSDVVDLCCGIGGDAMSLACAGPHVTCVDHDAVRAWMAGRNASSTSMATDVLDLQVPAGAFHIDPARRSDSGERSHRIADLQPGPDVLAKVCRDRESFGGCVKLGPGADAAEIENIAVGEVEYISEQGRLTQCAVWVGPLQSQSGRRATLIDGESICSVTGQPDAESPPISAIAKYLFEIDPSVERASLLCTLCGLVSMPMIHPRLGLLTGDQLISHPMLTPFRVLQTVGWHERKVRQAVADLGGGIVEVKTRGKAVDPDQVQQTLRGRGDRPLVVFVLRFDREIRAIIAERPRPPATS